MYVQTLEGLAQRATPPEARPCCMLAPTLVPWSPDANVVDPLRLGTHAASSEAVGIIYTGRAGFLDLGHLRDLCDLTKSVYDQIAILRGGPGSLSTTHGEAVFRRRIPRHLWMPTARAISYDDSYGYEIHSYPGMVPGLHNSAFSPEDLCSNYVGTLLAERAIRTGIAFNAAVTHALNVMIRALDGQTPAETLNAFSHINHRWVDFTGFASITRPDYLRRRNFDRVPWKAGHRSDRPTPSWITADLGSAAKLYAYTHTQRRRIPTSTFKIELAVIQTDARSRYGPHFNRP